MNSENVLLNIRACSAHTPPMVWEDSATPSLYKRGLIVRATVRFWSMPRTLISGGDNNLKFCCTGPFPLGRRKGGSGCPSLQPIMRMAF